MELRVDDTVFQELFSTVPTFIKAALKHSEGLPDSDKKYVRSHTKLIARLTAEEGKYWVVEEATLKNETLQPHLRYVLKDHWRSILASEFVALQDSVLAPQGADGKNIAIPQGALLAGQIMSETTSGWHIANCERLFIGRQSEKITSELVELQKAHWLLRPPSRELRYNDPLGYYFNQGGLNNQRFALLGLFLRAHKENKALVLPAMANKNLVSKTETPVPLHEVFDLLPLVRLAEKYDIAVIVDNPASLPIGGWEYFNYAAGRQAHRALHPREVNPDSELVMDFMNSLIPAQNLQSVIGRLKDRLFGELGIQTVAQFRIEVDWMVHAAGALKASVKTPEDYAIGFERITEKIARSLPQERNILVVCDEKAAPHSKDEMRQVCLDRFQVNLFWKSDFLTADDETSLNSLQRSIIDFELAVASKHFVGLTRSTFSNLVTFHKYAKAGTKTVTTDYIYNNNNDELSLRTDNGGHVTPANATA
jgi:hypothetical protein